MSCLGNPEAMVPAIIHRETQRSRREYRHGREGAIRRHVSIFIDDSRSERKEVWHGKQFRGSKR